MRHVVTVITSILVAVTLAVVIDFLMERRPFQLPPPPPLTKAEVVKNADETIARVRLADLAKAIADDGEGGDELQTFVGHAYLNVSERRGNMSIEQIFEQKLVLSAPSEEGKKWPRFIAMAWTGSEENYARAQKEAVRLLSGNNRHEDWKVRPCLQAVTRIIRPSKFGTAQNAEKMKTDGLALLYENEAEHFTAFGPPGSIACQ